MGHFSQAIPVPADFAEQYMRTNEALCAHYGVSIKTIQKFRKMTGLRTGSRGGVPAEAAPSDFREVAPLHTIDQLKKHYRRCATTIKRWCAEEGVKTSNIRSAPKLVVSATRSARNFNPVNTPRLDTSRAGMAAEYLRRFGPVVRCNSGGRYDPAGDHWRRGSAILTAAEIVQRAERNGWRQDAWREIAA